MEDQTLLVELTIKSSWCSFPLQEAEASDLLNTFLLLKLVRKFQFIDEK